MVTGDYGTIFGSSASSELREELQQQLVVEMMDYCYFLGLRCGDFRLALMMKWSKWAGST